MRPASNWPVGACGYGDLVLCKVRCMGQMRGCAYSSVGFSFTITVDDVGQASSLSPIYSDGLWCHKLLAWPTRLHRLPCPTALICIILITLVRIGRIHSGFLAYLSILRIRSK